MKIWTWVALEEAYWSGAMRVTHIHVFGREVVAWWDSMVQCIGEQTVFNPGDCFYETLDEDAFY